MTGWRGQERLHLPGFEFANHRQRVRMITFYKRDGTRYSANYNHLGGVHATDHGLRLEFSRVEVVVKGTGLGKIHEALTDHRVMYLRAGGKIDEDVESRIVDIQVLGASA